MSIGSDRSPLQPICSTGCENSIPGSAGANFKCMESSDDEDECWENNSSICTQSVGGVGNSATGPLSGIGAGENCMVAARVPLGSRRSLASPGISSALPVTLAAAWRPNKRRKPHAVPSSPREEIHRREKTSQMIRILSKHVAGTGAGSACDLRSSQGNASFTISPAQSSGSGVLIKKTGDGDDSEISFPIGTEPTRDSIGEHATVEQRGKNTSGATMTRDTHNHCGIPVVQFDVLTTRKPTMVLPCNHAVINLLRTD